MLYSRIQKYFWLLRSSKESKHFKHAAVSAHFRHLVCFCNFGDIFWKYKIDFWILWQHFWNKCGISISKIISEIVLSSVWNLSIFQLTRIKTKFTNNYYKLIIGYFLMKHNSCGKSVHLLGSVFYTFVKIWKVKR